MGRFDEIPGDAPTLRVHNAVFWLHDGIMFGKHLPHEPSVTLEDVMFAFQKMREMTGDVPVPLLLDGRGLGWLGMDARAYIRANASNHFTRVSVLVKHDLIRLLSHAFLGVAGVDLPVQLFTDEDKAYKYALSQSSAA